MELVSVERLGKYKMRLRFGANCQFVEKLVQLSALAQKVCRESEHHREMLRTIEKAAREANRDFIFREVGAGCRAHPDWDKRFPEIAAEVGEHI
jgi:hypothetical protein